MGLFSKNTPEVEPVASPVPVDAAVKTREVFTPSVPAYRGFVGRKREMRDLAKYGLKAPGTQIVVWGESGAGKSSLVNKVLEDEGRTAVNTACTPDTTYDGVLAAAFSGTGAFTVVEKAEHTDVNLSIEATIGSDLIGAKFTPKAQMDTGTAVTRQPIVRAQLSPQRLLAELGKRELSWVIEDFHKVAPAVRESIAHALKVFSDGGLKYPKTTIIVLGVSTSVNDLLARPTNLKDRIIDIRVPPLGHDELGQILDVGERLLNLDFSIIRDRLLTTSVGTASITHALALSCCAERDVDEASPQTVQFSIEDYDAALGGYTRTRGGNLRPRFTDALRVKRERTYRNTEIILRALTTFPEEGATVNQLLSVIQQEHPNYPRPNLTKYLGELQGEDRGALVRQTEAGLYRFDEPLMHAFAIAYFRPDVPAETSPRAGRTLLLSEWAAALDDIFSTREIEEMRISLEDIDDDYEGADHD